MTFEDFNEEKYRDLLGAIRGNGDEALTSVEFNELIEGYRAMIEKTLLDKETIDKLTDENTTLREINQNLMINAGKKILSTDEKAEEKEEEKEEIISDEEIEKALTEFDD